MPEFLTTRQLQQILHVDRTTIYRMADDGRLPAVKVGNQWRFSRRSIEGWLKAQSPATSSADAQPLSPNNADLTKLIPLECVQKIQDTFADMLGVMIVVTDLRGRPITEVSHPCGLFELVEGYPKAQALCQEEWAALANQPSLQPAFARGHLGLHYARGLVKVGSELKAMLVVGGIAPQQWPPDDGEIARMAAYLEVPEDKLRPAIARVFHLSQEDRQRVLTYVQRIADIIAHIMTERNVLFTKLHNIAELTRI
ncbi:MAG: PocR ligand-binding domain-containing protein [Caldilineaceae bacterium]|nr:PocR ligand-binding domain-containing protein [Caldilineaceae bacterium]